MLNARHNLIPKQKNVFICKLYFFFAVAFFYQDFLYVIHPSKHTILLLGIYILVYKNNVRRSTGKEKKIRHPPHPTFHSNWNFLLKSLHSIYIDILNIFMCILGYINSCICYLNIVFTIKVHTLYLYSI